MAAPAATAAPLPTGANPSVPPAGQPPSPCLMRIRSVVGYALMGVGICFLLAGVGYLSLVLITPALVTSSEFAVAQAIFPLGLISFFAGFGLAESQGGFQIKPSFEVKVGSFDAEVRTT